MRTTPDPRLPQLIDLLVLEARAVVQRTDRGDWARVRQALGDLLVTAAEAEQLAASATQPRRLRS